MRKARVLLVDDEVDFTRNLSVLLSRRDCVVSAVNDGASAVKILDESDFDVVLLDLKMPGMNGIETLKAIKKKRPLLEVIMLTGHGTIDSAVDAVEFGAFDYTMKPVMIDHLTDSIRQAFERKLIHEKRIGEDTP